MSLLYGSGSTPRQGDGGVFCFFFGGSNMESNGKGPRISSGGSGLPSRLIMHGTEGIGKSSFGAFSPRPIFAMTKGETGLLTLIDNGLVSQTPHFDECMSWPELLACVEWLTRNPHDYKAFVVDTINGAERLCFEHVARMFFGGDMLKFLDYGKGPDKAQQEWIHFLTSLDRLRAAKKMAIIALCHTRVKTFKNPEGNDFDRYAADMHEKTWGLSAKWADIILFATFETFAKKDIGALKAKGYGGSRRLLYTQRTAAWDAKNRVGLPEQIVMQNGPDGGWNAFFAAVKTARAQRPQPTVQPTGVEKPTPDHATATATEPEPENTPESNSIPDPVSAMQEEQQ